MSTTTYEQVKSSEKFSFGNAVADLADLTSLHCFSEIHILAVDDSIIDRKLVEKLLKVASYKVTTADTALRALEVLGVSHDLSGTATNEIRVNLILTDYCMPGMTGYDLLRRVKETSSLKEIPVVIMSAENIPDRITKCLADGAEEFILKPLRLADVKRLKVHIRNKEPAISDHQPEYAFESDSLYCNATEAQSNVSCDFVDISVVSASVKRRNTCGVHESSQCPQKHLRLSDDSND